MTQTSIKKEAQKELAIDNYDDFNAAILDLHTHIDEDPRPTLEVSERFFLALAKGRPINSMTYGNPGVRIFKKGMMDQILSEERMPAEKHRETEIKRISAEANK